MTLERAAKDGSWVTYCQADEDTDGDGRLGVSVGPRGELSGDQLELHLALAGRPAERIQAFWGTDPSERWLVVRQHDSVSLVDSATGNSRRLDLAALDLRELRELRPFHRSLAFQRQPSAALVSSRPMMGDRFELVQLSLADEAPLAPIAPLTGALLRLRTSHDGHWWVIEFVDRDTNQNGRLDLPQALVKDKPRCHASFRSFEVWPVGGDRVQTRLRSTHTGKFYRVEDFAGPLGTGFLFRDDQRTLWLRRGQQRIALAPADCGAQVVHADAERGLVLVACRGPAPPQTRSKRRRALPPRTRLPLWLVGEGVKIELELELGPTGADRWAETSPRLVPIHAGAQRRLLDMDTRRLLPLGSRDTAVATFDTRALILRPGEVELVDAVGGESLLRVTDVAALPQLLVQDRFALVSPYVFDLKLGAIAGRVDTQVLALASDGRVLQHPVSVDDRALATGPFEWRAPRTGD